ncbi:WD repeat-containing protein 64-like isoform X4 [Mercenaria mercenaria]|uniref:WD repeat-containing protein 64-like isoform X4 n=1 Tax=Mercenaria mercenaria TaxID=6596 RepID=UPI00234E4C55|nr:WD repeat-containing protein 64-like isoform X4 [Mercenaria mercenaria]
MSGETEGSERPYTVGSFQTKLDQFHELMKEITLQDVEATPEEKRQMITENLRYDQFCDAIRQLFGSDIKNQDLKALYRKISTNPDAKVDWSELFGYIQTSAEEAEEIMVGEEVSIFTVSKRRRVGEAAGDKKRRDTVQCLRYVPTLDCYISCSQKGALALWSNKLRLQACIDINEAAWVTGCDYLPSIRRASCCTERSIIIWDNRSKGKNQHVFAIKPFDHSPQCMVSVPKPGAIHEDRILFGDDQGYLNILTVAAKDLTMKNSKGGEKKPAKDQNILHVIEPNRLTVPMVRRKVHDDWVTRVKYFPELHCFASCSPSSKQSFVLEELDRIYDNLEMRGVAIHKGVNAFDYCAKANIIATGGVDKVIRVWHPHIFSRPTGKLLGHLFTIVDICCNERDQHIISLSTARVFRVWDIHTLTSLQVFTDNEERPGEKRIYSMLFDNKHERLLTGSSVIDSWPLTRAVQDTMQVPHTHDRPLSQLVYNKDLGQVVTVCTESVLKVWEMESGKLVYTITDAHKNSIEITALTLDSSGYRLASGAFDGSIKIWDFGSGQCIKERQGRASEEDLSITGLMYSKLEDDRVLIASGWNNKLKILLDTNENYDLPVIREFNDIYYYTQDVTMTAPSQSYDPFKQDPLPDIGHESTSSRHSSIKGNEEENGSNTSRPQTIRGLSNHQMSNLFKKEYMLMSNEISCMQTFGPNILLTGCTNGNIIQWDIEKSSVDKIFNLPEGDQPVNNSRQQSRGTTKSHEKRIHGIKILVHKTRRLDPAFIKKEASFHESVKAEDEPDKGATTERSQAGTPDSKEEGREKHEKDGAEKEEKGDGEKDKDEENEEKSDSDEEEKKDDEKSVHDEDEDPEVVRERENAAKYIVDTYDPVIVTVHQDAYIRFWNTEGHVLREITAVTRRQGTAVTAICHDADCNIMVTGDHKGYLTLWDIGKFLRNPESEEQELVKQVICWRAHLTKVVSLHFIDSVKAILSASTDGSARVWWGRKGRFVGFFGQHRIFNFPTSEEKAGTPTLPYDITEGPLAPVKTKSAIQKIRPVQKYEYPLIFDEDRWQPFKRSAYLKQGQERKKQLDPQDKKFFEALIKPKAYNYHLEGVAPGKKRDGAVFRALPVYRVRTPDVPKTPPLGSFRSHHVDVADGPQQKRSTALPPNFRDRRGVLTNPNPRFSTPASQRHSRMQNLYLQMQEKQKIKGSKDGSSTSFAVNSRRKSVFGKASSMGRSSVVSLSTGTPMLPTITTTPSSPRRLP